METTQTSNSRPTNWKEALANNHWKLKLADFGVQIDKDMRRHAMVERLIKKTQDGTLQEVTAEPMDKTLEEPMGVRIGDEIHYHNQQASKPSSTPQQSSSLGKTLAAAGLAAAGLGAGVALPIAAWNMTRPDTQVVVEQNPGIDTDTDTQYGLKIYRDD